MTSLIGRLIIRRREAGERKEAKKRHRWRFLRALTKKRHAHAPSAPQE